MAKRISRVKKSPKKLSLFEQKLKKAKVPFDRAFITSKWAAETPQHRDLIRQKLFSLTKDAEVLNFSTVSKCDNGYFSISHNPEFGALILARQPIGLDIESRHRKISIKTLNRITTLTEQSLELMPIEFWVAKEAAFKACSKSLKVITISEINIRAVKKNIYSKTFKFSIKPSKIRGLKQAGEGCILTLKNTTMGIAWLRP
jgi:hypothetical protein